MECAGLQPMMASLSSKVVSRQRNTGTTIMCQDQGFSLRTQPTLINSTVHVNHLVGFYQPCTSCLCNCMTCQNVWCAGRNV